MKKTKGDIVENLKDGGEVGLEAFISMLDYISDIIPRCCYMSLLEKQSDWDFCDIKCKTDK